MLMAWMEDTTPTPAEVGRSSPRPVRSATLRAWRSYRAVLAVASRAALVLVPNTLHEQSSTPKTGMGSTALAGLAEQTLATRELLPVTALECRSTISLALPPRPFPGQRLAPCGRGTTEIELRNGAHSCWFKVDMSQADCKEGGYEWKGGCYLPHVPAPRAPSSTQPLRTPPTPAERAE